MTVASAPRLDPGSAKRICIAGSGRPDDEAAVAAAEEAEWLARVGAASEEWAAWFGRVGMYAHRALQATAERPAANPIMDS